MKFLWPLLSIFCIADLLLSFDIRFPLTNLFRFIIHVIGDFLTLFRRHCQEIKVNSQSHLHTWMLDHISEITNYRSSFIISETNWYEPFILK